VCAEGVIGIICLVREFSTDKIRTTKQPVLSEKQILSSVQLSNSELSFKTSICTL
jgi:hypothetical protein